MGCRALPQPRLRMWRERTSGPNSSCCRLLEQLLAYTKDTPHTPSMRAGGAEQLVCQLLTPAQARRAHICLIRSSLSIRCVMDFFS